MDIKKTKPQENKKTLISVTDVSKSFIIPHEKQATLKEAALNIFSKKSYTRFDALKDINFEVKEGEFFGIVGRNGSGKSTLLKMLAGIYVPDKGRVVVDGNLSPFLELGVGFNPDLTARENVFLGGTILGLTRFEIKERFDDIIKFAELEEFIDLKFKNFSSGMQVRLAFSLAINAYKDILLMDEVLAVGDVNFQKKCFEVFKRLKREGKTIVFVSHSMGDIRKYCDRVMVIDKGKNVFIGNPEKAVDTYNKINMIKEEERLTAENEKNLVESVVLDNENSISGRYGDGRAKIIGYKIYDYKNKETLSLKTGEDFKVELIIDFKAKIDNPTVGVMFKKNPQENLFGLNSYYSKERITSKNKNDKIKVVFSGKMLLNPGTYYLTLAVADADSSVSYVDNDILDNYLKVNVYGPKEYWGIINSDFNIQIEKNEKSK